MRKLVAAIALAIGVMTAGAASAGVTRFSFSAGSFDFSSGVTFYDGNGSFETAGDTGTFTLNGGLVDFNASGVQEAFEFGGDFRSLESPFAASLADLRNFTVTLDAGRVTALQFATRNIAVPFFNEGERTPGRDRLNLRANIDRGTDFAISSEVFGRATGELTLAAVPEPATWAMMIAGIGGIGGALRRRTAKRPALA